MLVPGVTGVGPSEPLSLLCRLEDEDEVANEDSPAGISRASDRCVSASNSGKLSVATSAVAAAYGWVFVPADRGDVAALPSPTLNDEVEAEEESTGSVGLGLRGC